ncbi:hypothetical protein DFQ01_1442 [Paenibacillus cellulosilyticus]|uniref:Uncharacterized protein n=1 Tax=Paenibacillus cellulosilyticus TaxID=375489 RepID=A0A2V2YDV1_9BACL|nr:hypothetical protein [Paenibacillus cellulosilyticus]PWV90226.1 hypothetical protein DFQ01_1442 [Paenibacillus cellulosilyticus]QKS43387.1 hypothetical protein HUB94_02375 [Paenibacillus cellulosilyticus]
MSISIQISGENAAETVQQLAALATFFNGALTINSVSTVVAAPEQESTDTKTTTRRQRTARTETAVAETTTTAVAEPEEPQAKQQEPEPEPEPEKEQAGATGSDELSVTIEALRAKATAVAQSGKQAQVKALLTKFGVANISTVPEDKRSDFFQELEKLEKAAA